MSSIEIRFIRIFVTILFVSLFCSQAYAQNHAPLDFDLDGISDVLLVEIRDDENLRWSYLASSSEFSQQINLEGSFGKAGDHLIASSYFGISPSVGFVRKDGNNLLWRIRDSDSSNIDSSFGLSRSLALITGADFTGDGYTDLARIAGNGRIFVAPSPFTASPPAEQVLLFPKAAMNASSAFGFLRRSTTHDSPILIRSMKNKVRRYALVIRNTETGKREKLILSRRIRGEIRQIIPVRGLNGLDAVALLSERPQGTFVLTVFSHTGKRILNASLPKNTDIITGRFADTATHHLLATVHSNHIDFIDPFAIVPNFTITIPNNHIVADHVNVNSFRNGGSGNLSTSCRNIQSYPSSWIYKRIGSTHFSDCRRSTAGLIIPPGAPGNFSDRVEILDSEGNLRAIFGGYYPPGGWKWRGYACHGAGRDTPFSGNKIANDARAATGRSDVYIKSGSSCYGPIDPARCYGSSQC